MDEPFTLRSRESKVRSPIRFTNNTDRNVNLLWLNYVGDEVSYGILEDKAAPFSIDSFVTHLWIAVEEESKKRLWLNSEDVFYPPTPEYFQIRNGGQLPVVLVQRCTDVYITVPVYNAESLQELCCEAVGETTTFEDIDKLPVPNILKDEIKKHSDAPQN